MANPYEGMEFSDDDEGAETYISMESFRLSLSENDHPHARAPDMTGASQYSDIPMPQDSIDDSELMNNVAEDTFPPGSRNYDAPLGRNTPESHTIPQPSSSSSFERAGRTVQSDFADFDALDFSASYQYREEEQTVDRRVEETPRAIRNQIRVMQSLAQHTGSAYGGDQDTEPSVSEAVSATTVQNYFKQARQYTTLANPNQSDMELQLFSRIGEAGDAEENALQALALGEKNALSRIVEMMAYTVEFQTHELNKVKSSGIDIFQQSKLEDHNNWSQVDSRRSMCIKSLLQELDNKDRLYKELEIRMSETKSTLVKERSINSEFQHKFEKLDPSIRFEKGPERAYNALHNIIKSHQRTSEAKAAKQRMEIEEYAERLLEYERKLNEMQRQKNEVIKENTKLRVELASHADSDKCHHKLPDTNITCEFHDHNHNEESSVDIDIEAWHQEKSTLTEVTSELRKELRITEHVKVQLEDSLFKANIDLDEAHRKIKSLRSQLADSQASAKILKESHDHLQKHSREVAKELSQNTIDAAKEIDRKESQISQLRYELEDRELALKNNKKHIAQLEKQITEITDEAIRRGQSMATATTSSDSRSPGEASEFINTIKETSFTKNMQREYNDAKELISEKTEEIIDLEKRINAMERNIKLAEDECEMWKSTAQNAASDYESMKKQDMFEIGGTQSDIFLRRLSTKLNVQAGSTQDILRQLVERIEELIREREVLEKTKEELNERIVERETFIHSMQADYDTEISALGVQITQLKHSCDRAEKDRLAVENKLAEIANAEEPTMDTMDGSLFDDEGLSFDAAKRAVGELVESKIDLASAHGKLKDKLDDLLGGVKEGGSTVVRTELVKEARDQNNQLLSFIGEQSKIIKNLQRSRNGDANTTRDGQDDDTTWREDTTTMDSEVRTSTYTSFSRQSATSFVRNQLAETREKLTEKINDNTKLSTVIKEMEHKMEFVLREKNTTHSQFKELSTLHEKFVKTLAEMLQVNATTVVIESTVKNFLNMTEMLRNQISESRSLVQQQSTRIYKFSAQKRVLEHIIGIYQRKYHLNILSLPSDTEDNKKKSSVSATKRKLRACVLAVRARNRILNLFTASNASQKQQEFVDITKAYSLPGANRIADARLSTIPIDNALLALQSVEKLRKALASKDQEINDLRQSLIALDQSLPLPSASTAVPESGNFDYDANLQKRKNVLSGLLTQALADKEKFEVQLSHERNHRANSEARANKYLEKAKRLHGKLQTVKLTSENRERTYRAAIRYFKQKAESAIDVGEFDFENAEPNNNSNEQSQSRTYEMNSTSKTSSKTTSGEYVSDFVKYLMLKLEKESKELETLTKGTPEHDAKKTTVNGIRATLKNLTKSTKTSKYTEKTESSSKKTRTRDINATTTGKEGSETLNKNTAMGDLL